MENIELPTQRKVVEKLIKLTDGNFCSNERGGAVFLNNVLLGKRKLPIQYKDVLLEAYGVDTWEELKHFFPKMKDLKDTGAENYFIRQSVTIEIEVKKGKTKIAKDEIASVLEAISILQSKGLELALKVEFLSANNKIISGL